MVAQPGNPSYLSLLTAGELKRRVEQATSRLSKCDLCPWVCKVDRHAGQLGFCRTGVRARVSSYAPHLGEENVLRGWRGSGTIFFSRCNLRCQYCQNYDVSQTDAGREVEPDDLASMMLELQALGCHNINFVSPSHVLPQLLAAVQIAARGGLCLPLVYNSGGYDSISALELLDGVVDIYMPDMKYAADGTGRRYSLIPNYPRVNQAAVREMYRQVGDLQVDEWGLARRGLLVRHLVLPDNLAGSDQIIGFLANEISTHTFLNLMDQYRPAYKAHLFPELRRRLHRSEFEEARRMAQRAGLDRLAD
jgi:putative pyruvate formate lyase activating enzyme